MILFRLANIFLHTYYNPGPSTALLTKHSVPNYSNSVPMFSNTTTLLIPIRYNIPDFLILAIAFAYSATPTALNSATDF